MGGLFGCMLRSMVKKKSTGAGFATVCGFALAKGCGMIAKKLCEDKCRRERASAAGTAAVSLVAGASAGLLVGWCTANQTGSQFKNEIAKRVGCACTSLKEYAGSFQEADGMTKVERKTKEWFDNTKETFTKADDASGQMAAQYSEELTKKQ